MTTDLNKLKVLATAAAANQYDAVALNDYGTAVPPATVLGLIAEIERHRLVNAEGRKPDSINSTNSAARGFSDMWINICEERPGDQLDGMAVIVSVIHHRRGRISECDLWNKGCKKGRFEFWGNKVTHWQPLPTPPGDQKSAPFNSTEPDSQQQESHS